MKTNFFKHDLLKEGNLSEVPLRHYSFIDALRGVAVLLVVLVHFGQGFPEEWLFVRISTFGHYGVQLFFVLSAYTLCLSAQKNRDQTTSENYWGYLVRRLFRIAPLYYLAIVVYYLFSFACVNFLGKTPFTAPSEYNALKILSNLLLLHGLYPPGNNNIVPGGWSVGCEFLFYLIFPVLLSGSMKRPWILLVAGISSFLGTLGIASAIPLIQENSPIEHFNTGFLYFSILNQMPCFFLGIGCFLFKESVVFRSFIFSLMPFGIWGMIIAGRWHFGWLVTPLFSGIVWTSLLLISRKIEHFKILKRIGQLSYSIYICHFIPVWTLRHFLNHRIPPDYYNELLLIPGFLIVVLITYVIAVWTNRLIELPMIGIGRDLSKKQGSRLK